MLDLFQSTPVIEYLREVTHYRYWLLAFHFPYSLNFLSNFIALEHWFNLAPLPAQTLAAYLFVSLLQYFLALSASMIHRFIFAVVYLPLVFVARGFGLTDLYFAYTFNHTDPRLVPVMLAVRQSIFLAYSAVFTRSPCITDFVFRFTYWFFLPLPGFSLCGRVHAWTRIIVLSNNYWRLVYLLDNVFLLALLILVAYKLGPRGYSARLARLG